MRGFYEKKKKKKRYLCLPHVSKLPADGTAKVSKGCRGLLSCCGQCLWCLLVAEKTGNEVICYTWKPPSCKYWICCSQTLKSVKCHVFYRSLVCALLFKSGSHKAAFSIHMFLIPSFSRHSLLRSHCFIIDEDGGCVCKLIFRITCNWIWKAAFRDYPLALLCLSASG